MTINREDFETYGRSGVDTIPLLAEGRTVEIHYGVALDIVPKLLKRWDNKEGYIPSEGDWRELCVNNYEKCPELMESAAETSTFAAMKGNILKIILPYETGSKKLTEVARFNYGLISSSANFVEGGIGLDYEDRWERQDGNGVYTFDRRDLVTSIVDLSEEDAQKHKLILTKFGHPDYVEKPFWRIKSEKNQSIEKIQELIHNTFKICKKKYIEDYIKGTRGHWYTYDRNELYRREHDGMAQELCDKSDKGVLRNWFVEGFYSSKSGAGSDIRGGKEFVFNRTLDFENDVEKPRIERESREKEHQANVRYRKEHGIRNQC